MVTPASWLNDILGQEAYDDGVLIEPTIRRWDFVGFSLQYNPLTDRVEIRGGAAAGVNARLTTVAALPANTRTNNILTATGVGALTVDGVAVAVGNLILVKDEGVGAHNGLYDVTTVGDGSNPFVLTRNVLFNETAEVVSGLAVYISEGTQAQRTYRLVTIDPITINVTALVFSIPPAEHPVFTVATLPTASANTNSTIMVSDETGGHTMAFSDGTNWRRVQDRAIVS